MIRALNFMNKAPLVLAANTFIGGVASTINTPALLATKLEIDVSRITNFSVVGSDIQCRITGTYTMPSAVFQNNANITYFNDVDGLVSIFMDTSHFENCYSLRYVYLPNTTSIGSTASFAFTAISSGMLEYIFAPRCTSIGTVALNNCFLNRTGGYTIYVDPFMATSNSGSVEGDLVDAVSKGAIVRYVTNFTAPSPVTTLTSGNIYERGIQLNFTVPSSTNAIDYYECYANGVRKNNIKTTGGYISALTASTNYNITIFAVDIFMNKSAISNSLNVSTNTTTWLNLDSMVSFYNLNETTGSTLADSFGSNTLTKSGLVLNQSGKIGVSVGSSASGDSAFASSLTPITGDWTINMWCYRTGVSTANAGIIDVGAQGAGGSGFGIWINLSGQVSPRVNSLNINNYSGCPVLTLNTWEMLTMVYNRSTIKTYINAVEVKSLAFTINPKASNLIRLFNRNDAISQPFTGKLDLFSLYREALTLTDINTHYNAGNGITL